MIRGHPFAVIEPRLLPRAEILVLRMLNDNDDRAIHFSRTSADLAESLVASFKEHQQLFESRLQEAQKDTVGLLLGPLEKVHKVGKMVKQGWSYYQMWEPVAVKAKIEKQ